MDTTIEAERHPSEDRGEESSSTQESDAED